MSTKEIPKFGSVYSSEVTSTSEVEDREPTSSQFTSPNEVAPLTAVSHSEDDDETPHGMAMGYASHGHTTLAVEPSAHQAEQSTNPDDFLDVQSEPESQLTHEEYFLVSNPDVPPPERRRGGQRHAPPGWVVTPNTNPAKHETRWLDWGASIEDHGFVRVRLDRKRTEACPWLRLWSFPWISSYTFRLQPWSQVPWWINEVCAYSWI
jgi:hypothetical protein